MLRSSIKKGKIVLFLLCGLFLVSCTSKQGSDTSEERSSSVEKRGSEHVEGSNQETGDHPSSQNPKEDQPVKDALTIKEVRKYVEQGGEHHLFYANGEPVDLDSLSIKEKQVYFVDQEPISIEEGFLAPIKLTADIIVPEEGLQLGQGIGKDRKHPLVNILPGPALQSKIQALIPITSSLPIDLDGRAFSLDLKKEAGKKLTLYFFPMVDLVTNGQDQFCFVKSMSIPLEKVDQEISAQLERKGMEGLPLRQLSAYGLVDFVFTNREP